jgi:hypothetical protein
MIGVSAHTCNTNQAMENQQVVTDVIIVALKELVQVNKKKHSHLAISIIKFSQNLNFTQ